MLLVRRYIPFCLLIICALVFPSNFSFAKKEEVRTNQMPKTMSEYYQKAQEQAQKKEAIPTPALEKDSKLIDLPKPKIALKKYNNPPGMVETNLKDLKKLKKINSIGAASPDGSQMVYTSMFYYPASNTTGSELYLMNLDKNLPLNERLAAAHIYNGQEPIYKTGMSALDLNVQKTLTVLDWSSDGKKVAFKQKTSYSQDGLWQTNLLVYDFTTRKLKDLTEVRSAIKYYWRKHSNLDLNANRWDIFPLGWDANNPERIILFAYAYTGAKPKYLGAWSIDYQGDRSLLMSLTSSNFDVSQNGISLKQIAD